MPQRIVSARVRERSQNVHRGVIMRSVSSELCANAVEADELAILLGEYFPRGSWEPSSSSICHMTADGDAALIVEYTKRGQIIDVKASDIVGSDLLDEIAAAVEAELLGKQDTFIRREVLFSLEPVRHQYRHHDSWQIIPVPADAPQSPASYAQHPFLIEMTLPTSSLLRIRISRAQKRLWQLHLVLSLLLHGRIEKSSYSAQSCWVLDGEPPGSPLVSRYLQGGYTFPSLAHEPPGFSELDGVSPMQLVADDEYFARLGVDGSPMTMPAFLPGIFDGLEQVPDEVKERFLRSCYWLDRSSASWSVSASLSYLSLVNAIETLVTPGAREECPHCQKDMSPGPTHLFREFVDRHAPAAEGPSRVRLYELRSDLVHGEHLLLRDRPNWTGTFEPATLRQDDLRREMYSIARVAIVNWFRAEMASSEDPSNRG